MSHGAFLAWNCVSLMTEIPAPPSRLHRNTCSILLTSFPGLFPEKRPGYEVAILLASKGTMSIFVTWEFWHKKIYRDWFWFNFQKWIFFLVVSYNIKLILLFLQWDAIEFKKTLAEILTSHCNLHQCLDDENQWVDMMKLWL